MKPDIERMAKEAGLRKDGAGYTSQWSIHSVEPGDLAKFAALIAEACAKECEGRIGGAVQSNEWWWGFKSAMKQCAASIRHKFPMPALSDK